MERNPLRHALAVALALAVAWIGVVPAGAQLSDTLLYDYSGDYQGWILQFAQRHHNQSGLQEVLDYLPFTPEGWDDATRYPFAPGSDPLGDGQGAFAVGLRLEGVWDNVNPERRWFDAAYVQSEDWFTHMQTGWPAGYEHHPDYTGSWTYGHYGSLGAVSGDYLRLRLYNPGFAHAHDPVQGWFYTKSGSGWTWVDGGQVNLERGWNVLRFPVSAIADAGDLRELGVKIGASHPVWGEMYVDAVTLGATTLDNQRLVYMTPDIAWISEEAGYDSKVVRIYYDDGGQMTPGVRGFHLVIDYPADCVQVTGITQGTFLSSYSNQFAVNTSVPGQAIIDWVILGATSGASGFGSLAAITFTAAAGHAGDDCCGLLDFDETACRLRDPDNQTLAALFVDGQVSHDITPPDDPLLASSTHAEGGHSAASDVRVSWATTQDQGTCPAGVRGYYLLLDQDPSGAPDPTTADFTWFTPWVPDSVEYVHWFEDVPDGSWYVHIIGYDYLWNDTAVDTYGPIHIDTVAPGNVTGLAADITADADLSVDLAWTNPGSDFAGVRIYRQGFGNYPEYDDPPNAGAVPAWPTSPADALANGWTLAYDGTGSGCVDQPAVRDYYYYAAFAYDAAENYAAAAPDARDESLCYWLGDFTPGTPVVGIGDVLVLSASYNTAEGNSAYNDICDIGPTTDYGRKSRPTTDNLVEFEDLMVFAMNYETTRFAPPGKESPCSGAMTASLALSQTGSVIEARVLLQGNPDCLLGASVRLAYDPALEFVAAAAGDLWPQGQSFFDASTPRAGELVLDAAALGAVVSGEGCHAVARFRAGTAGEAAPQIAIAQFRARGTGNADLAGGFSPQGVAGDAAAPRVHRLLGSQPNPAIAGAWIHYQLAGEERVSLQLFDATGRRVRTLVEGVRTAGEHRLLWDGRRSDGAPAEPGVYFCRLEAGDVVSTRRVMLVR